MDPVKTILPDHCQEEIKGRILARDGDDNEDKEQLRPRKRRRADTASYLDNPPLLFSEGTEELDAPKPESTAADYDSERLRKGLRFICRAQNRTAQEKRDFTPRTMALFAMQKEAITHALDDPSEATQAVVKSFDHIYWSHAFYFGKRSPEAMEVFSAFVRLRKLEVLAMYGDYLSYDLAQFRLKMLEEKKKSINLADFRLDNATHRLSGKQRSWEEIAEELDGPSAPLRAERRADIVYVCDILGFDAEQMIWCIKEYAARNGMFHSHIKDYIKECEWDKVKQKIALDLAEVHKTTFDHTEATRYEVPMLAMLHDYFEVRNINNPSQWRINDRAIQLSDAKEKEKEEQARNRAAEQLGKQKGRTSIRGS